MKKKLLFISPTGTLDNGGEISIFNLMKHLVSLGYEVVNVGPDYSHPGLENYKSSFEAIGVKTYMLPAVKWWWREAPGEIFDEKEVAFNHRAIVQEIRKLIRQNGIDLVVSNTVNVYQGAIAAALEKVPHFWLIHEFPENEFEYYKTKIDLIDQFSDEIFGVQGNLQKALSQLFPARDIKTFIPFSEIQQKELKNGEKVRLVNIGRLSDRKNQIELIKAFEKLQNDDLELLIIGEDKEEAMGEICREYIAERHIKNVTFLGNQVNPWDFVTDKDIFITPSKTETFGLVAIEAMLNGVPVIMSENPGHDTVHDIFQTGMQYPLGKVNQLAEKIRFAVEHFAEIKADALLQAKKVEELYTIDNGYEEFVTQLEKDFEQKKDFLSPLGDLLSTNASSGFFSENLKGRLKFSRAISQYPIFNSHKAKVIKFQIKKLLKNPSHIFYIMKKVGRKLIVPVLLLRKKGYQILRNLQRKELINPKRALVYVIYEDQPRLQTYKLLFLEALSKIADQVVVVVNGTLAQEDIKVLETYGQVELRENEGYDVAAFRHGVKYFAQKGFENFDELMLVNDTNVGPLTDLSVIFDKMDKQKVDFWGISYGEEQFDVTGYNPYGVIPKHLQSYFLVIKKNLLRYPGFIQYWDSLNDTNSRDKAIGRYETVFTKKFEDRGFKHTALTHENYDSAMYIHPFEMIKTGVPLVKFSAFLNNTDEVFEWQGLERETEIPRLLEYIKSETDYPIDAIEEILLNVEKKEKARKEKPYVLIIDGVENQIPQCTTYRVLNKAEQIRSFGYEVHIVNASDFQLMDARYASHIIIYRTGYQEIYRVLKKLVEKYHIPIYYDIDDLVFDTRYTDQLSYTKNLPIKEKANYDAAVEQYGKLLRMCDGAITTTSTLKNALEKYNVPVLLNRNLANRDLVEISNKVTKKISDKVKIGYFSGSITHNENFELIKPALIRLLQEEKQVELHLVGHLDIPEDIRAFKSQIVTHDYMDWHELPEVLGQMDINLAPLVTSVFNAAKSEIKWLEAALVKVPTLASDIGAYQEMIRHDKTGVLVSDEKWFEALKELVVNKDKRIQIAENAKNYVLEHCITLGHYDDLLNFLEK